MTNVDFPNFVIEVRYRVKKEGDMLDVPEIYQDTYNNIFYEINYLL
jgi:hypothetical protein